MGVVAQGGTFTYVGSLPAGGTVSFVGNIVGISVETPQAEIVDMTGAAAGGVFDPPGASVLIPTGAWTGGSITVEYLKRAAGGDPQTGVRSYGVLSFVSPHHSISKNVVCESASESASVGDLVRGTVTFRLTDFAGY